MQPSSKTGVEYPSIRPADVPFASLGTRKAMMREVMMPRRAPSRSPPECVARVSERVQVSRARERSGPPAPQSSCITPITSVPISVPACAASCRTTCCLKVEIRSVSSFP
eukprot:scaffold69491_cov72-Phaeocystis_antarctica.AAC.3